MLLQYNDTSSQYLLCRPLHLPLHISLMLGLQDHASLYIEHDQSQAGSPVLLYVNPQHGFVNITVSIFYYVGLMFH